jgi:hypothetical protein
MEHIQIPAHVQRLRTEHEEVETKLRKLDDFIENNPVFSTLDEEEINDLVAQGNAMEQYLEIVTRRLERALKAL